MDMCLECHVDSHTEYANKLDLSIFLADIQFNELNFYNKKRTCRLYAAKCASEHTTILAAALKM